jgi:hypothetical protein
MGLPEPSGRQDPREQQPAVRARTIDTLRMALERPLNPPSEVRAQQARPNPTAETPQKKNDVALAMALAREAVTTAAKAAEDELRQVREQLERSEACVKAAEERAQRAEERARVAEAQRVEAEKLLANIRDQIVAKVTERRAA